MKLYIIRHGETNWNKEKRLQGQHDVPLNEKGLALARQTGEGMKNIHFDYAFSSPLSRAFQTAQLALGERGLPITKDDRIQEISFGDWEGECILNNPLFSEIYLKNFYHDPFNCPSAPNGETFQDVVVRTTDFYHSLLADDKYKDASILISTHGAASRCLLTNFYEDKRDLWRGGIPANCSVCIVDVKNGIGTVLEKDKIYA